MNPRQQKAFKALAVFLAFSFAQVYVQTSFADPSPTGTSVPLPQQFVARLTTTGNRAITVNGASASGGATILTGATIETPDQVGATVNLGSLGTLDIAPNTKLTLEFDNNGNVKVKLVVGCVVLKTKKGTGEVETPQGGPTKSDKKGGALDVCFPAGAAGPTTGAVAAGAGAGAAAAGGAAGGGLFGLGTAATVAIVGGAGAITTIAIIGTHGENPSP